MASPRFANAPWALLALTLAGCGDDPASVGGSTATSGAGGTGAGAGGSGAATATTGAVSSTSIAATSTSTGTGTGGGFVCDPPAEPGSIYELSAVSYDINEVDPVSMCRYRGDVMLIVNTAAL